MLQDRLVAELGLDGVKTVEEGNKFLGKIFIKRFNARFALQTEKTEKVWRKPPEELDRIISFGYVATVANDNTVRLGGITFNIQPGANGRSYAKAKVEVRQLMDGSWRVYHGDNLIAGHRSTAPNEAIRTLNRRAKRIKSYSWIYLKSKPDEPAKGTFLLCT